MPLCDDKNTNKLFCTAENVVLLLHQQRGNEEKEKREAIVKQEFGKC
jgi:hypothetical protein